MSLFIDSTQFWMIATRVSGFILMIPAISQVPFPTILKAMVIFWISLAIQPTLPAMAASNFTPLDITLAMGYEFLFGLAMGYIVRMLFAAIEMGGTMVDTDLGYRLAEQINPALSIANGIVGRIYMMVAIYYFWAFDIFPQLIYAMRESFVLVAPMSMNAPVMDFRKIIGISSGLFTGALIIAAPIMALMFAISVGVGFIARSVQGINLFFEVYTLRILVGLSMVLIFLPLTLKVFREQFMRLIPAISNYLSYYSGS